MSFRKRLTLLFVAIVLVAMTGFGVLSFWVIGTAERAKSDARVAALSAAAIAMLRGALADGGSAATRAAADPAVAHAVVRRDRAAAGRVARRLLRAERLARVRIEAGGTVLADVGERRALAPARRRVEVAGSGRSGAITVSALAPSRLASLVRAGGGAVVVTRGGTVAYGTVPGATGAARLAGRGTAKLGGREYRYASFSAPSFAAGSPVRVAVLTDRAAQGNGIGNARGAAVAFLAGFAALAFVFAFAVSRSLHSQVARFLAAARRLGSGDFSQPVPMEGRDEFARLAQEFNAMAAQLERRLGELGQERARLRESIRRIGETFASNLDRRALLQLGAQTAVDAVDADGGRVSLREGDGGLAEAARAGDIEGPAEALEEVEARTLQTHRPAETRHGEWHALAAPLGAVEAERDPLGVVSVVRRARPFTDAERDIFTSLAGQAGVSIENVALHEQIRRQATTDELTGLANHRRFQQALDAELERARRFEQPVALVMLDVDNFKRCNDTYGHPQGDEVLRAVARALQGCSRDVDVPARYGGEEMALILPQTDSEGAYQAAERVRTAVESLRVPRLDRQGELRVTVSVGVATTVHGGKDELIAAADRALYEAKRSGKNRTVRGVSSADVVGG